MTYDDLSTIAKSVYKFYKVLHLYNEAQVETFVSRGAITREEADFIYKEGV